jgi:hypothetical protein
LIISFGFRFKQKTRITTSFLIAGGALRAVTKIIEPTFGFKFILDYSGYSSIHIVDCNRFHPIRLKLMETENEMNEGSSSTVTHNSI